MRTDLIQERYTMLLLFINIISKSQVKIQSLIQEINALIQTRRDCMKSKMFNY